MDTGAFLLLGGNVQGSGMCRALATSTPVTGEAYDYTVWLYNAAGGQQQANYGHPSVVYNVKDEDNFDYITFR